MQMVQVYMEKIPKVCHLQQPSGTYKHISNLCLRVRAHTCTHTPHIHTPHIHTHHTYTHTNTPARGVPTMRQVEHLPHQINIHKIELRAYNGPFRCIKHFKFITIDIIFRLTCWILYISKSLLGTGF